MERLIVHSHRILLGHNVQSCMNTFFWNCKNHNVLPKIGREHTSELFMWLQYNSLRIHPYNCQSWCIHSNKKVLTKYTQRKGINQSKLWTNQHMHTNSLELRANISFPDLSNYWDHYNVAFKEPWKHLDGTHYCCIGYHNVLLIS